MALTIAYCGNFRFPHCTEVHIAASLGSLGHKVVRLQENELDWSTLAATVEREQVSLLLWTRTWNVSNEEALPALAQLRSLGVPSVSVHLDRWWGLNREHQIDDQPFFRTDLVVSPDDNPGWEAHGVTHLWMPPGVFHAECTPVRPNRRRWLQQVVFVGSHPYPHDEWRPARSALIDAFAVEFARRFAILPIKGRPIRGRYLQELYATVPVILGDSCLAGESHSYYSDRVPETLGRGGLLIHQRVDPVIGPRGTLYTDEDLLTYNQGDIGAALALAHAALDKPDWAQQVREHGRATVLARDTYVHRMTQLLDEVATRFGAWA